MKSTILVTVMLTIIFSMSSCKKCYTCKQGSNENVTCKTSNESQKEYNARITLLEGAGWQCK